MSVPTTQYATTADGLSIAYQDLGGSGPAVIWVTGTASHIELFWQIPGWAHAIRSLASVSRFIWFDKRGAGLSDRTLGSGLLEDRMEDIRAVMDATGVESATLIGLSESGAICAMFAAAFPERVNQLILVSAWAHNPAMAESAHTFESSWGEGWLLEAIWAQGMGDPELMGQMERAMATPRAMAALIRANAAIDVRPVLPVITVPTLVVHCTGDPAISVAHARELAALLPNATLVEIDAAFHGSARPEDMQLWGEAIEPFVLGSTIRTEMPGERVLATVLFTDIVGSTERAAALGDTRWAQLLDDHDQICTRAVEGGRGRILKMTGDGLLATFDGPATAITAAHQMIDHLGVLGLHLRAGVHTGEVERRGQDIGGIGVNLAARVMGAAANDEVWVSSTVPGLTVGAPIDFAPMGTHDLKGIPGRWDLFGARITTA
ncbi:MAG: adenylate/guanylate cyclase domain-containing protein [Acidimicrobiales bacterium]|nr:adenylate/guanylate cyclase domain-containing protein [Acidimicrobiales bacterium]